MQYCGLVTQYSDINLVNINSGNGLLPPPENTMGSCGIHLRAIRHELLKMYILDMSLEIDKRLIFSQGPMS